MTRSDIATAKLHREWLRRLPALTGLSLTAIAQKAGLARSTLTRPLKDSERGISTLHAATVEKVCKAVGVPAPEAPPGIARSSPAFAEDAAPFAGSGRDSRIEQAVSAIVAGRNGIAPWTVKSRALELAGILPGDVVLVDLNAAPEPGDAVCAQVYDWSRMRAETVMRVLANAGPLKLLISRSMDPAFNAPLVVDDERVVIKGVVLPHRLRPAA